MLCPQGNWATSCCPIEPSGHARAKSRIYLRFRTESPFTSGNALRRSPLRRSRILLPPALSLLPSHDVLANSPIEQDELTVDRQGSLDSRGLNTGLELVKKLAVTLGFLHQVFRHQKVFRNLPDSADSQPPTWPCFPALPESRPPNALVSDASGTKAPPECELSPALEPKSFPREQLRHRATGTDKKSKRATFMVQRLQVRRDK